MKEIKVIQIPCSKGCYKKNVGTEKFPAVFAQILGQRFPEIEIKKISVEGKSFEESIGIIKEAAFKEFSSGLPFFVGGDHSITFSIVHGFNEKFGNDNALIVFDAHVDCTTDFLPASSEDIIRGIAKQGLVKPENILLIGVRKVFEGEKEFLERGVGGKIKIIKADEVKEENGLEKAKKEINELIKRNSKVYVSIDIDAFDPEVAPATDYLEENGLLEEEFFEMFEEILKSGKVAGIDLSEINPEKDKEKRTLKLAEKIFKTAFKI